jgi:hypothetical protein
VENEHILRALKLAGRIRQVTSGKIDDLVKELESQSANP